MIKTHESYVHEGLQLPFTVEWEKVSDAQKQYPDYEGFRKKITIKANQNSFRNGGEFVFKNSKAKTVIEIGRALLEIGEFVEGLKYD